MSATPLGPPEDDVERESNSTVELAEPLVIGERRVGRLTATDDTDRYRFTVSAPEHLRLLLEQSPDADVQLILASRGQTIVQVSGERPGSPIDLDLLLQPGDYLVSINPYALSDQPYAHVLGSGNGPPTPTAGESRRARPMRQVIPRRLSASAALGCAVLVGAASAMSVSAQEAERAVTISHGSVADGAVYIDLGEPGPSVGDVRAFSVDATDDSGRAGRLTATLVTSSSDWPAAGDELRLADIVMMFGDGFSDQLVITGASLYPGDSSTITPGDSTIRPIGGGSGIWNGARGYVETIHSPDDTWQHIFHLLP